MIEVRTCALCGSGDHAFFAAVHDGGREVRYNLCRRCGLVFQSPRMTEEELDHYYRQAYAAEHQGVREAVTAKERHVQGLRARHLVALLTRRGAQVQRHLDIGSSAGLLMQAVAEAFGAETVGVEPGEVYRRHASASGLTVYASLEEVPEGAFDLVTMSHVLEHLPDPVGYLRRLRQARLAEGGWLLVEVPNLFGHPSLELPHLYAFHPATLRATLEAAGYRVEQLKVHGVPRSRLLPLYLTALARPVGGEAAPGRSSARGVRLRWRLGTQWRRWASRLAPGWAWLPVPQG